MKTKRPLTISIIQTGPGRNQDEEFEQKSQSSQRLVQRLRCTSMNLFKFKKLGFAPQAKQFSASRTLRLLFKLFSSPHSARNCVYFCRAALVVFCLVAQTSFGGITNTVPWSDSFESCTNGMSINGTNGWGTETDAGGVVTTNTDVTALLTNYPVSGRSYPLPTATHSNVLQVTTLVTNTTHSVSGGVVWVDFMVMPEWMPVMPVGDTSMKFAVCVSTNGKLTIWHHDTTVSPATNLWLELANSTNIPTNAWARFTILQDFSNQMFQVQVNEGSPISDNAGWTVGGALQNGSWFHMVQTNPAMVRLGAGGVSSYLDDVVVSKRALTWSRTNFMEGVTNNGAIDNSVALTFNLTLDTFTGTAGDDLVASNKMTVLGLPSNLTAVATLISTSQASVILSGTALAHEAVNSTNLTIQFADNAFAMRSAWDVTGSRTDVALTFSNTPSLSYSTNHFYETSTNNGTIDNSLPMVITLTNGAFAGTLNEDFAENPAKLVVLTPPTGLTVQVLWLSSTQLQMKLLGVANSHGAVNNVSGLALTFQNGAFNTVPVSSVFHASTNVSISFIDPSGLSYLSDVFTETAANNGAVSGTTLTLSNKFFNATNGEDLVASGKATYSHLPGGLGLQLVRGSTAQEATLIFTSAATSNAVVNNVNNFNITFLDTAFVGGNAAGVGSYNLSNLQIYFNDPRTLTYSGTNFTELSGGMIDNRHPVTITLSGDTFQGSLNSDFAGAKVTVAGTTIPGLSSRITLTSPTQLTVTWEGTAPANTPINSVNDISFTFQDGAFTSGNAVYVGDYQQTGISINFISDSGFFNVVPYEEPFEAYASGTLLSGTNGWSALYHADACMVTNNALVTSNLLVYLNRHATFPTTGTHTQVLFVQDYIQNALHSETAGRVYLDFMTVPVPLQADPEGGTNMQFAFYVSTNCQVVIWHRDMTGSPVNQWLTLTNSPLINTSSWVRFTVTQDYTNNMFQVQVNEGLPISDVVGWSQPSGGVRPGSWFHMVQTNGSMSLFGIIGVGEGYLDDLTVRSSLPAPFGMALGTIFTIR